MSYVIGYPAYLLFILVFFVINNRLITLDSHFNFKIVPYRKHHVWLTVTGTHCAGRTEAHSHTSGQSRDLTFLALTPKP